MSNVYSSELLSFYSHVSTISTKIIDGSKDIIKKPHSAHNVLTNLLVKFVDIVQTIK